MKIKSNIHKTIKDRNNSAHCLMVSVLVLLARDCFFCAIFDNSRLKGGESDEQIYSLLQQTEQKQDARLSQLAIVW